MHLPKRKHPMLNLPLQSQKKDKAWTAFNKAASKTVKIAKRAAIDLKKASALE